MKEMKEKNLYPAEEEKEKRARKIAKNVFCDIDGGPKMARRAANHGAKQLGRKKVAPFRPF